MSDFMLILGSVQFKLGGTTLDTFEQEISGSWVTQDRVGRRPAKQNTGIGDEAFTISGQILPFIQPGGLSGIDQLRKLATSKEPVMLASGRGKMYGYVVVESVRETRTKLQSDGSPFEASYTVTCSRYGEDNIRDDAMIDDNGSGVIDSRNSLIGAGQALA